MLAHAIDSALYLDIKHHFTIVAARGTTDYITKYLVAAHWVFGHVFKWILGTPIRLERVRHTSRFRARIPGSLW